MDAPEAAIERELKLAVPPRFRLPALPVLDGLTARLEPPVRYTTDFYDTTDLALAGWDVVLRFHSGEGWRVKLPNAGRALLARPELAFGGERGTVPQAALEVLTAYLRGRSVERQARTRAVRRRTLFIDKRDRERLALVDDRVTAIEPEAGRRLRQLEIELRAPDASEHRDALAEWLEEAGALPSGLSKYHWALGGRAPGTEVVVPDLGPDSGIGDVIRAALATATRQLIDHDATIREGGDPEAIHQARIATRRLRSHLRTFGELVDPSWATTLRDELRVVGDALGRVRDTEVLAERLRAAAERLDAPRAAEAVAGALLDRLAEARGTLAATMSSADYLALLDRLIVASAAPKLSVDPDAPAADALRPVVQRTWRRLRRRVRRSDDPPTDDELHRVRIEAKRARYASETIAPLVGKRAAAFARAATRLQDVLGEHRDATVAWNWLHDEAREARIDPFTAGELAALELAIRDAARVRWPKAWKRTQRRRPSTW